MIDSSYSGILLQNEFFVYKNMKKFKNQKENRKKLEKCE
ncbi:hypothetical protein HMPREF9406_1205 [Clostridium sp. HGF2]|nr:hypothetical protein HMPREF9406_1205 [Clostridium sp. HGF2]EQJ52323.1 hypothetical protein QSI_3946 [Clostridioides difficile P28]